MDDADRAELECEQAIERALAAQHARAAADVAPVLARDGTRLCADCGERIKTARLRALPHAVRCIHCAAEHERTGAQGRGA
jgi:phage/conjugal plasmid C-4 type zinc finger TraR family protein